MKVLCIWGAVVLLHLPVRAAVQSRILLVLTVLVAVKSELHPQLPQLAGLGAFVLVIVVQEQVFLAPISIPRW